MLRTFLYINRTLDTIRCSLIMTMNNICIIEGLSKCNLKLRIYLNLSKFFLENSCARTDAIFTPYPGFKSHVKGKYPPHNIFIIDRSLFLIISKME